MRRRGRTGGVGGRGGGGGPAARGVGAGCLRLRGLGLPGGKEGLSGLLGRWRRILCCRAGESVRRTLRGAVGDLAVAVLRTVPVSGRQPGRAAVVRLRAVLRGLVLVV